MNKSVSVIAPVFRPGGLDILLEGMKAQTYSNFEVIVIDRLYHQRREVVQDWNKEYQLNLVHAPEYRRNGKWISFCSGFNTGLALARGEIVIFLGDWMCAPPGWIENHLQYLTPNRYTVGSYRFHQMPALKIKTSYDFGETDTRWKRTYECVETNPVATGDVLDHTDVFKQGRFRSNWLAGLPPTEGQDLRVGMRGSHGTGLGEGWLHMKNDAVYRKVMFDLNGFDERLERGRGPLDIDIQVRLAAVGIEAYWTPDTWVYYIDPHIILPTLPFGSTNVRLEGRWSWLDGHQYVNNRKIAMALGKETARAKNPWNIEELAEKLEPWRAADSQKESQDLTDLQYWGREIWPDTP